MAVKTGGLCFDRVIEWRRAQRPRASEQRDNREIQSHGRILSPPADAGMLGPNKAQRPIAALTNAYARRNVYLELRPLAPTPDTQRAAIQTRAIRIARNRESLRQFTRTVREPG